MRSPVMPIQMFNHDWRLVRSRFSSHRNYLHVGRIAREPQKNSVEYLLQGGQQVLILTLVAHDILHEDLPFFLQGMKYLRLSKKLKPGNIAGEILPVLSKHFNIW